MIFVYILQGKMGKTEKNLERKNQQLKWPKYQKPKDKNMGWTKHKALEMRYALMDFFLVDNHWLKEGFSGNSIWNFDFKKKPEWTPIAEAIVCIKT